MNRAGHAFVVPAYGDSPHLPDCLESIRAQSQPADQVVLCTSTPSEYLQAIAQRFDLQLIETGAPSSIAGDWNFALSRAETRLVTIAHQDDLYEPDYARAMRAHWDAHPRTAVAFCDYQECTDHGPRPDPINLRIKRMLCAHAFRNQPVIADHAAKRRLVRWGNPVCCPSVTFNRALLPDFRFASGFRTNLDWDAWARLADTDAQFGYLTQKLVRKRVHEKSETTETLASGHREREDRELFSRFWPQPMVNLLMLAYRQSYHANKS
jgi:Glycosyl transferase family 2